MKVNKHISASIKDAKIIFINTVLLLFFLLAPSVCKTFYQ